MTQSATSEETQLFAFRLELPPLPHFKDGTELSRWCVARFRIFSRNTSSMNTWSVALKAQTSTVGAKHVLVPSV